MNNQVAINNSILSEMNLKSHSEKCIHLFLKCLNSLDNKKDLFEPKETTRDQKLVQKLNKPANYYGTLKIIYRPNSGFGEELLNSEDEKFFNKPLFLPFNKQQKIIHKIASYYEMSEDQYFEKIIAPMNKIVDEWLSSCWQKATDIKNFDTPINFFVNQEKINPLNTLLEGSYYNLESSTINRIKLWKILITFGNIQTITTLN